MRDTTPTMDALGRAGRRAAIHLVQAMVEGLKAVEAVLDELRSAGEERNGGSGESRRQRIEIE